MSKRDAFWDSVPESDDGQIKWPDDANERSALANDVLGAKVVGAMDAIVEDTLDIASGNAPKPGAHNYEQQAAFRAVFHGMTDEQRDAVRKLVRDAASGTLYWILVKLDNFPNGAVRVAVEPWGTKQEPLPECRVNEQQELHHLYFDWVERFSEYVVLPTVGQPGKWE